MRKIFLSLACLSWLPVSARWQPVSNPAPMNILMTAPQLDAVDAQTAWFCNSGNISRTADGGQTWQAAGPSATPGRNLRSGHLEAIDAQRAWLLTAQTNALGTTAAPELLYTANGGTTWTTRTLPSTATWQDKMHFFTLSEGILVSYSMGVVHRTTDGGATWQLQRVQPSLAAGYSLFALHEQSDLLWFTVYNPQFHPRRSRLAQPFDGLSHQLHSDLPFA
ncbi:hypothetical protein SAMN02746009_01769 [Hymenobacter psychrotolerans DSM 18569]|uniref:Photosynthesis system II assembly factor Ycf48/Hcf136-like domain-containing protein n=1 Tax=Hymenobacter psychrotolerans DSM 18569 TaxID=1121959 RepID=A0A1M6W7I2_9BACT|nr:hypothetical protein SAMN02746009_01769 [Hymenobacter psychrotolerans DSM 18569]